jgi:histidinol-phosphate phosphatase family protein
LILLDRDGVINKMVVDSEHGTIDSPLHPAQVEMVSGAPEVLARLSAAGFRLAIVSNQPAAAKGKTTVKNLEDVHAKVVMLVQAAGAKIASSHICFHRAEDHCACRKPKTGLLEDAFHQNQAENRDGSWMVGDGITDIQAGQTFGAQTAYIGAKKTDAMKLFDEKKIVPTLWVQSLEEFVNAVLKKP